MPIQAWPLKGQNAPGTQKSHYGLALNAETIKRPDILQARSPDPAGAPYQAKSPDLVGGQGELPICT